jgi:integrase
MKSKGGRPTLPAGTYGKISTRNVGPAKYMARARFRGHLGETVPVARYGQTKGEAERRLRIALAEMQASGGSLTADFPVRTLAERWLTDEIDPSIRAAQTKTQYRYAVDQYIAPRIGALRVREVNTKRLDEMLRAVEKDHGPGAARLARAVLNGMFSLAVRHQAMTVNPVRETRAATGKRRTAAPQALTRDDADQLIDKLRGDEWSVLRDLPDLAEFGLATGCRIGEMLAVRDAVLDADANTLEVNATTVSGADGRVIQERPKTAAGWRVLALPPFAVAMIERRRAELRFNPQTVDVMNERQEVRTVSGLWVTFPDPLKPALRDPAGAAAQLRTALDRLGYKWVTFHTFRKTAATRLDEAGMSAREIADQLGHSQPSMTQNIYMGRKVVSTVAARVLDR